MKLLLVGRVGSGTTTIEQKLAEKGMSPVKTYTTRPKTDENDDSHIFIKEEDIDNYPDKAVETHFDGNTYFITERQLEENDILIINPDSIEAVTKRHPNMSFVIIYIEAGESESDKKIRQLNAHLDAETFERRCKLEDDEFKRFEELISSDQCMDSLPENVFIVQAIRNDWSEKLNDQVTTFMNTFRYQRNLQVMIRDCVIHQVLPVDENMNITLSYMLEGADEPSELTMSPDILACKLMTENCAPMLQYICSQYFGHHNLKIDE